MWGYFGLVVNNVGFMALFWIGEAQIFVYYLEESLSKLFVQRNIVFCRDRNFDELFKI